MRSRGVILVWAGCYVCDKEELADDRIHPLDLREFLVVVQPVDDFDADCGCVQRVAVFLDPVHRVFVLGAGEEECWALHRPRFDGGPIAHRLECDPHCRDVVLDGGEARFPGHVAIDVGAGLRRALRYELVDVAVEGLVHGGAERHADHRDGGHALRPGTQVPGDVPAEAETPNREALHTAGVGDGFQVRADLLDGEIGEVEPLLALAVAPNIDGDDCEVRFQPFDVAQLVPVAPRLSRAVQEHQRRALSGDVVGDARAICGVCVCCGHRGSPLILTWHPLLRHIELISRIFITYV